MKGKNKWLAILACVLMVAMSISACTSPTTAPTPAPTTAVTNPTTAPTEAPAATPAPTPAAPPVVVSYASWGTVTEHKAVQDAVDIFNKSQSGIEVEVLTIPWESYVASLNTMAAAKNLPDTAMLQEPSVISWAQQGMLADISSMYSADEAKPLDCITYKYNGKPVAYSAANEVLLMYYNKDMFDKAGIAYPPTSEDNAWTWDQFVSTAKQLTLDKNGKHPDDAGFDPQNIVQYGCLVEDLAWQLEWPCLSNGGGFYSSDYSKVAIGDPASIEAIQDVADLYLKDHVAPLSTGATDDGVQRGLLAGNVAMTTNGAWNVGTCLGDGKKQLMNYGVAVLPYMKNKVTLATGGANVVFTQSANPTQAMEWIKWYYQEDNSWSLISSGIWMPIHQNYYTDDTLLHKWIDNPDFPPFADYKSAVVDVAMDNNVTHSASWFHVNHSDQFNALLTSVLGDVWTGKTTAQDAITKNLDQFNAIFNGTAAQ